MAPFLLIYSSKEFVRALLPHMRLLTLTGNQLSKLTKYLTRDERLALVQALANKDMCSHVPHTLCRNQNQRMGAFALVNPDDLQRGIIEIIPRELLLINFHDKIENGIRAVKCGRERNVIKFIACRNLRITGMELIAQAASRYNDSLLNFADILINNNKLFLGSERKEWSTQKI